VVQGESESWYCLPGNGKGRAGGVVYVIDEVHVHFDARAWATIGPSATFYNTQHRKLSDDCIFVTQHVELVEKRFRMLAQEFVYLRNLSKARFGFGMFAMPSLFVRSHYLQPFTGQQKSMETRTFALDAAGLAKCYDTAAGIGFVGAEADKGQKKKGMHWSLAAGLVVAGITALCFVPSLLGKGVGHVLDKMGGNVKKVEPRTLVGARGPERQAIVQPGPVQATNAEVHAVSGSFSNALPKVTGIFGLGFQKRVMLDNGETMDWPADAVLEHQGRVICPMGILSWRRNLDKPEMPQNSPGRSFSPYGPTPVRKRAIVNFHQ